MINFIRLLRTRYESLLGTLPRSSEQYQSYVSAIDSLILAEVAFRKAAQISSKTPRNVVVFGPTQSGKSTLVNCLLPEPVAIVSSLAGFTTHPQGFVVSHQQNDPGLEMIGEFFQEYKHSDLDDLDSNELKAFSLTQLPLPVSWEKRTEITVWDTPDFDSIGALGYSDAVLRTIGLADVLILVVSKEKYADQSVWDMLELIKLLRQPMIICLNKVGKGEDETLSNSFLRRYQSQFPNIDPPPVTTFPFIFGNTKLEVSRLVEEIELVLNKEAQLDPKLRASTFIKQHWEGWLNPVYAELEADKDWTRSLESEIEAALDVYQQKYLDHPHHYETFQRTLAELLELLEIPMLAKPLTQVRKVITWPARQIVSLGGAVLSNNDKSHDAKESSVSSGDRAEHEIFLLKQLAEHLVTQLANTSFNVNQEGKVQEPVWEADFRQKIFQSRTTLQDQFEILIGIYQKKFDIEIQRTANQLYGKLEEQPALLNSLRVARASTDAAAVVLTFKTGGLSFNDFLLAPAMLSLSSLLAESSLGQYVKVAKSRLKVKQREAVKFLFTRHLQTNLSRIRQAAMTDHKFMISEKEIREAVGAFSDL